MGSPISSGTDTVAGGSPPLLSILLLTYNQQDSVSDALAGALSQTYQPLEIIVSDDASTDATYQRLEAVVKAYHGPHKIVLNRNPRNLGIGANLSHAASLSSGVMLLFGAGDDISVPERCDRIAQVWMAAGRRPDLIASHLTDMDQQGGLHGPIAVADLGPYQQAEDWLAHRPHVIGAGHAWTRRLFDRFGPLPPGLVAEDQVMTFRAICSGGAITIPEALVRYRRGGVSGRVRAMSAQDTIARLLKQNRHALIELKQLQADARVAGCEARMQAWLRSETGLAVFIRDLFGPATTRHLLALVLCSSDVAWSRRIRLLTYAAWPWLLTPFFALKRLLSK